MTEKNKFVEMLCPVCGKYLFTDDSEEEKEESNEVTEQDYCTECGWVYDLDQTNNPDLQGGNNEMSLNEYRVWYARKIKENPQYVFLEEQNPKVPHVCPVCGKHMFSSEGSWEICPVCGWVDDPLMEEEPEKWAGNANDLCLNDYRKRYEESKEGQ